MLTFSSALRLCKLRATTDISPDATRSAHRKGAQPVINGTCSGIVVHQVGNHSSWENKKLMRASVLVRLPSGETWSQKRSRKRRTIRITFPISNPPSAFIFSSGSAGWNSIAPGSPAGVCKTPRGTVSKARLARNETGLPRQTALIETLSLLHATRSTAVLVLILTLVLANRSRSISSKAE